MEEEWLAIIGSQIAPALAKLVFHWIDEEERVHLARHLPRGRHLITGWQATPDGPLFTVSFDFGTIGRGGVQQLLVVPVSDEPGFLPPGILPDDLRAELERDVVAARDAMPAVPDTVAELLDGL